MTTLPPFAKSRVLVLGDIMLDRYWYGATTRISPEAPVPVVQVNELVEKPGGAANVAMNITGLGAEALLMGWVGEDEAAQQLEHLLKKEGVETQLLRTSLPTITKLRVLSHHQQLIRLDFEQTYKSMSHASLLESFKKVLPQYNVVVMSDYGKGVLAHPQPFIQAARAANVPVLVDPKRLDFEAYAGATLVTPNRSEFEAVVGHCASEQDIVTKGMALLQGCGFHALLITRGEQGMTLLVENAEPLHLPALAREVYDVTGAGDTVIGVLAASLGAASDLPLAVKLANAAAGVVVGKLGTATVSPIELSLALTSLQPVEQGVVTLEELLLLRAGARARGEKVVITNGCFDILHAGHITYLEQAKALGDRLIVAVNDDASVARLKGPTRPLNPLAERMQVLAGLRAIDWVVPFSSDTPRDLIAAVLPDILTKGGDYQVHEIAGHKEVLANGGEVIILDFVDGLSTSNIINKIKA
jgi:D-beta-D-heptose 7-phosphate kinase/D-beta-D-heptose 1-phosphate adenosyltransferase